MADVDRREIVKLVVASAAAAALPAVRSAAASVPEDAAVTRMYRSPLDHLKPAGGTIELPYILVGSFDPRRRTLLMLADGQQFYIRQNGLGKYRRIFGDKVNIIGLPGRGSSKDLLSHLGPPQSVDWAKAYQLLRYEQWTHDADLLRRQLLGKNGKVLIYGQSGGGRLAHEYMIEHGGNALGVCTESAVFESIEAEIGVEADTFWRELSGDERRDLSAALAVRPDQRELYAQLLQRQNYFVDLAQLPAERRKLIASISADQQSAP